MIQIAWPQGSKHLELRHCYEHREAIKGVGSRPDVQWDGVRKVWLVDARLFDKLAGVCGHDFAPVAVDVFMRLPEQGAPATHRQTPAERAAEKRAAAKVGKAIVEMAHQQKG